MDRTPAPKTSLQKQQILDAGRELIINWTDHQFTNYCEKLQQRLFHLAEKAHDNDAQNRYYQSRDEINRYQAMVRQNYLKQINLAYQRYRETKLTTTDFSLDPLQHQQHSFDQLQQEDLSLVDNTELEEKLAIGTMSRKASADCSEAIYALNQRLAALRGGSKMTEQGNPVAPGVFGEALQYALADLTLDDRAKLIFYKVFDAAFMVNLKHLYEQLNQHCQSQGILPSLAYEIKKTPSEQQAEQLPEELRAQLSTASQTHQVQLFRAIRLLQSQLQKHLPPRRPAGIPSVPLAQILSTIQQLQLNAGSELSQLKTPQAVAQSDSIRLRQQAEQEAGKTDDVDAGVIEIVGLLFEYMLNDRQLPDSVKTLLSYLHTPVLKAAMLDPEFFNHPNHPARQLLNSLVAAGERWVDTSSSKKNDVFEKIKTVVQRLLKEFHNDIDLFVTLGEEFNDYLRQHTHRIRLAEKRALQTAQGENKLKVIRLKIAGYLKEKTAHFDLPEPIQTLIFEPWANYLAFNLLRFGSRSDQWRKAAQVVDDILWYCQPHDIENNAHDRSRVQELEQSLSASVQTGFDTVGYDDNKGKKLLAALHEQQKIATSSAIMKNPELINKVPTLTTPIDEINIDSSSDGQQSTQLSEELKHLRIGTWYEFNADTDTAQRVKLAWCNPATQHYMFVNKVGQQVAVKSGPQLADELDLGKIAPLQEMDDKPFFEKAMERVLDQLKNRKKQSHG